MINEYVLGFVFNASTTDVALLRKSQRVWQASRLDGIRGHIERGEHPYEAMRREAEEQVALVSRACRWCRFAVMRRELTAPRFICHTFRLILPVEHLTAACQTMGDQPLVIADPRRLPADCLDNLFWLIPMALEQRPDDGAAYELAAQIGPAEEQP